MSRYASQSARSVFVGNIPYNATDEEIEEVFRTVGTVVKLRLVKNPDGQPKVLPDAPPRSPSRPPARSRHPPLDTLCTACCSWMAGSLVDTRLPFGRRVLNSSRPQGFGFAEFKDPQTAESAIRNLNNHEMNGRQLRVDYASNFGGGGGEKTGDGGGGGGEPREERRGGGGRGDRGSGPNNQQQRAQSIISVHEQILGVLAPVLPPLQRSRSPLAPACQDTLQDTLQLTISRKPGNNFSAANVASESTFTFFKVWVSPILPRGDFTLPKTSRSSLNHHISGFREIL